MVREEQAAASSRRAHSRLQRDDGTNQASTRKPQAVIWKQSEDLQPANIFVKTLDTGRLWPIQGVEGRAIRLRIWYHKSLDGMSTG